MQSEFVANVDKRRGFVSEFTGSAGKDLDLGFSDSTFIALLGRNCVDYSK